MPRDERRLLDIGCGDGSTAIDEMWPDDYEYRGIDVDPNKVDAARRRNLTVDNHDIMDGIDEADCSIDVVVAKAVLEHVEDPLFAVQECHRVLRPSGEFWAIVPSDRSYDIWGDYTHKRAFRRDALVDLLTDGGFDPDLIRIQPRMGWESFGAAVKSILRIASPITPYGYPRAWSAVARKNP